jgi:hypothetical protein
MNIRGALKKAQELFGKKATVSKHLCVQYEQRPGTKPMCSGITSHPQPCPGNLPTFTIGRVEMGMFNAVQGQGMTWGEAFARAERRKHEDLCRKCIRRQPCKISEAMREKVELFLQEELAKFLSPLSPASSSLPTPTDDAGSGPKST